MQVIGLSAADGFIESVAGRSTRPEVAAWARRVLARHVRRERSLMEEVSSRAVLRRLMKEDGAPAHAVAAVERGWEGGGKVYAPSKRALQGFTDRAYDTMDWIASLPRGDRRIRRIERMSWQDAERLAADWHAALARVRVKAGEIMLGVRKVMDLEGGSFAAILETAHALKVEGSVMGHCVGGYWQRVNEGSVKIASIRDANGQPHVTVELAAPPLLEPGDAEPLRVVARPHSGVSRVYPAKAEWVAVQVRGKQNRVPVRKWEALVREWLSASGLQWAERWAEWEHTGEDALTVYTAYSRSFMSPERACAFGEPLLLAEMRKGKRAFGEAYRKSGLADIHAAMGARASVQAFLSEAMPHATAALQHALSRGLALKSALGVSGMARILETLSEGEAQDEAVRRIHAIVRAADPAETYTREAVFAQVPGACMRIAVHEVPLAPLLLLSAGYGEGIADEVADDVRPRLEDALHRVKADPGALHCIVPALGGFGQVELVRGFMFCGLAGEYAAVAGAAQAAVKRAAADLRLAAKRMRASGEAEQETLNRARNRLADGWESRLADAAREFSGGQGLAFCPERPAPPAPLRRQAEPGLRLGVHP